MYFQLNLCFSILFTFISCLINNDNYKGYKIYNVKFTSQKQQDSFDSLRNEEIDFLRNPSFVHGQLGKAIVPASLTDWFEEKLRYLDVNVDIYTEDVFDYIEKQMTRKRNRITNNFGYDRYYRYEEILEHLHSLDNLFSPVQVLEYGRTVENRSLVYIKISTDVTAFKPVIIIESAINPREWITIPAALKVIDQLLNAEQQRFLDYFDWIFIPVVNPDGYEYTHTNLRFWQKTLSTGSNLGFICPGVNVNRNFDIDWLKSDSSSSPCSHLYGGSNPFTEVESLLIKSIIEEYGNRTMLYISLQNNGNFISYPWQYEHAASGMFRQHHLLANEMVEGTDYMIGTGSIMLADRTSGTSSDYSQMKGILYSFNLNIAQDENDSVMIPEENIESAIDDIWRAVFVAADKFVV